MAQRTDYQHPTYEDWFNTYLIYLMWCVWHWQRYRRMHNL